MSGPSAAPPPQANKPPPPPPKKRGGSSIFIGLLIGLLLGIAIAAVFVSIIMRNPSPYVTRGVEVAPAERILKPSIDIAMPPPQPGSTVKPYYIVASGVPETKPRFGFYDALSAKIETKPTIVTNKPAIRYLQAATYENIDDAEHLKITLLMKGLDATVQPVSIIGHGEMYRVKVGPFQTDTEASSASAALKLNGLEASPIH
jgi:cell division protein FtsN